MGKNGVFIVETKNHAGVITGKTDAEWWSQMCIRDSKQAEQNRWFAARDKEKYQDEAYFGVL